MTTPEPAVDLELIAALIDGRLTPADRERAIQMLATSDAALEVFVEVVRTQAEIGYNVVPISRARRWGHPASRWLLAPVAAVLLFMILPRAAFQSEAPAAASAGSLVGVLGGSDLRAVTGTPGWQLRSWSVARAAASALADSSRAFRLGVRTFDLQIAVSQNDRETADRLMAEMLDWISTLPFSEVIAARYRDLRRLLMAGRQREQLLADAAQAESALGELLGGRPDDSFWFNFGKWSAAAELAASVHSRPFFQSDLTGRVVRDALARAGGTQGDSTELRRAADLTRADATHNDFKVERDALRSVIKKHAE